MQKIYNESSPKKAANLSINSDLLSQSKNLNISLSSTLEKALIDKVKSAKRGAWIKENKDAINLLNDQIEQNGLFSDSFRKF